MAAFALTLTLLAVLQSNNHVFGFTAPTLHSNKDVSLSTLSPQRNFFAKSLVNTGATTPTSTALFGIFSGAKLPEGSVRKTTDGMVAPNSLKGKTMVVIGGSAGMGLAMAKAFAKGGAKVVLTSRTDKKGDIAVKLAKEFAEKEGVTNDNVYAVQLDLDDLDNIKSFPDRLVAALKSDNIDITNDSKIDVLMNNAGIYGVLQRELTKNGYERTFQSNYLGHFTLTAVLKPYLKDDVRIINTTSDLHLVAARRGGGLDLTNLNSEREYAINLTYGQSHLCKVLWTQELQRRADAAGLSWSVNAAHPGIVSTDIPRNSFGGDEEWYGEDYSQEGGPFQNFVKGVMDLTLLSPEEGAGTQVYLAVNDKIEKGKYYNDLEPRLLLPFSTDEEKAKQLWEISEKLAGIKYSF